MKTTDELNALKANGATIEEMKVILSSYDIEKENIIILPLDIQNLSPDEYDFQEIKALFD